MRTKGKKTEPTYFYDVFDIDSVGSASMYRRNKKILINIAMLFLNFLEK